MLDRKTPPQIHDAIEFDYVLPAITTDKLDNGLPVYWLNAGVQDVVEIDWVFPAGLWYEHKEAVSQAVAGLLKNGTNKYTAAQIHEALEYYGASLKVSPGNDYSLITLHTLTKHLPQLLSVVYDILTDATFPQNEIDIYRQNSIQRLLVNLRHCDFVANQQIDAVLFGESHPYGRYTKQSAIEAYTREDLLAFYSRGYDLSKVKIFMAGNIGSSEVKLMNEVFGKTVVTEPNVANTNIPVQPKAEKKLSITNDPNGVQGAIRLGRIFPNRHHPDFAPMVVLNTLFGGYFGSRLMSNIREDKGYTYGIYSSLSPYSNSGTFSVHTEVGRDVIEAALKEIYHEMKVLQEELADEEELLLVKNYLLGNLLGDLDGPFSILQRWRTLVLNDMNIEHFNRNINIYKTITAQELQALAQKYFNAEDYHEVVVV
ncbi:MAG: insulinase family protein [Bacteroidetes bacterium]|nr:insulinase family protein [Bacteroidota bacterium]